MFPLGESCWAHSCLGWAGGAPAGCHPSAHLPHRPGIQQVLALGWRCCGGTRPPRLYTGILSWESSWLCKLIFPKLLQESTHMETPTRPAATTPHLHSEAARVPAPKNRALPIRRGMSLASQQLRLLSTIRNFSSPSFPCSPQLQEGHADGKAAEQQPNLLMDLLSVFLCYWSPPNYFESLGILVAGMRGFCQSNFPEKAVSLE